MMDVTREMMAGVVLCGGAGARLGGRKAMQTLAGKPLVAHVAGRLLPHIAALAVAGDEEAAAALSVGSLDDPPGIERGPLAGVLSGLEWAAARGADWLAVAPCDTPLLSADLIPRLLAGAMDASSNAAFAKTADGLHPLVAVWRCSLASRLRRELATGHPPVHRLLAMLGAERVWFEDAEAFMNVNTQDELRLAETRLAQR